MNNKNKANYMAQFTNQAQLSYNNTVTNSNVAVGEVLEVLSMTKTAVNRTYNQGDNITYIINIVNSGNTTISGLTLTDNLGNYFPAGSPNAVIPLTYRPDTINYFINGAVSGGLSVAGGPPLVIGNITVPAGGNATIVYDATVNQYAPLAAGGQIDNSAVLSGGGIQPISADETITVDAQPNLTITKAISPVPVSENGNLTYTFTIQNYGAAPANGTVLPAAIVVTDQFNPILTNLNVQYEGTQWQEGTNYQYSDQTGLFETNPGQITIDAATFSQDPTTGVVTTTPSTRTLVVSGTV